MVHILQNDPAVPAGNIVEFLPVPPRICRLYRGEPLPEPGDVSSLIVLGGSMGANDDRSHPFLTPLKLYIRHIVTAGIPFLGICLGGQLLAEATGGRAVSGRWEELGTLPVMLTPAGREDRLFRGIPEKFVSFHWHHDSFDLPADGVLLATSEGCPHHAFRVGERAWGLQFHPEVTEGIIRDWCAQDRAMSSQSEEMAAAFARREKEYRATAACLLNNFLAAAAPG